MNSFWRQLGFDVRSLVVVGAPLIVNNLSSIGVGVADTMMSSRLGAQQLAGVAIGNGMWIAVFLLGLGTLMALGPTVAQHFGAGRDHDIGHDTRQGMWLAILISALVIFAMRHMAPLFVAVGIEHEVALLAQGYLDYLSWGVPGAYGYHTLKQMNEGVGRTVPIMTVVTAVLPLNVLLNYSLLFGRFGLPALGAQGCGLGSALSFWIMLALLAGHTLYSPHYRRFHLWRAIERPDGVALRRLMALGLPIGVSLFLQSGLFTAVAMLMGTLGSAAVAAHQITLNYCGIVFMAPLGLAMALTTRVGQAVGRGDMRGVRRIGLTGFALCALCTVTAATTTLLFAPDIIAIYTKDARVTATALALFKVGAALQMADGLQVAAAFALRGMKDTRVPLMLNALNYWGIGFTLAYLLGHYADAGATGIWTGLTTTLWVASVLLVGRFLILTQRLIDRQTPLSVATPAQA
jgi:MATE family multidrug resistance protein